MTDHTVPKVLVNIQMPLKEDAHCFSKYEIPDITLNALQAPLLKFHCFISLLISSILIYQENYQQITGKVEKDVTFT